MSFGRQERGGPSLTDNDADHLLIGWTQTDITPPKRVAIRGQFHVRLSENVHDPLTATVMLAHRGEETAVMVSCDLISISPLLQGEIRERLEKRIPQINADRVCLFATHTHTGPELDSSFFNALSDELPEPLQAKLNVMSADDYVGFAADRIVTAIGEAWERKRPGGISWGMTHAVVGHNRRWTAYDGVSTMYGNTNTPDFSHVEGWEDHSLRILCTWDAQEKMTGMIVNVPCPSQVSEHEFFISADFWHETRAALRRQFGDELFVLPQCAPAGDLSPRFIVQKEEVERMRRLKEQSRREEIAETISDAVGRIVPYIKKEIDWYARVGHHVERVGLTRRSLTEEDVSAALAAAEDYDKRFDSALRTLKTTQYTDSPRWYVPLTRALRRSRWLKTVQERYESQHEPYDVDIHIIRLGDFVFATNPFELYVDFGLQIQARSKAKLTFLAQLAGGGTYLSTARATVAGGYGSVPSSNVVGPEGGRELVNKTVELIDSCLQ